MGNSIKNNKIESILLRNQTSKSNFDSNFKNIAFSKPAYYANSFDHQKICIHKFGGSSLATSERLLNVVNIIKHNIDKEDFIVVSANSKITDWLIDFAKGDKDSLNIIKEFYDRLLTEALEEPKDLLLQINEDIEKLRVKRLTSAEILAFGEVWSATLLVALLNEKNLPALFVDARELLKCNSINSFTKFDTDYFFKGIEKHIYGNFGKRLIITGYIASNLKDETITLGRNGSDYTASLCANLSEAQSVTLWTDVKGIYTADPSLIKQAQPIPYLSYNEAKALASTGTNVLHHKSINPLLKKKIPLYIRSSLSPKLIGSCVSEVTVSNTVTSDFQVTSIALKESSYKITINFVSKNELDSLKEHLLNNQISIIRAEHKNKKNQITLLISDEKLSQSKKIFSDLNLSYVIEVEPRAVISIIGNQIINQTKLFELLETSIRHQFQYTIIDSHSADSILLVCKAKQAKKFFMSVYQLLIGPSAEHSNQTLLDKLVTTNKDTELTLENKSADHCNRVTNLTLEKAI